MNQNTKKTSRRVLLTAALLALVGLAGQAAAFFWLQSPTRSNPNDPQSDRYQPVAVGTPTNTPTITPSPTPVTTPWLPLYDGENSGFSWASGSFTLDHGPGAGGVNTASEASDISGGAEGTASALSYKIQGSGLVWAVMVFRPGITLPMDVSTYNTLSLWVRVPSTSTVAACNNFRGVLGLEFNGAAYPNDRSKQVMLSAYVVGADRIGKDTWVRVQIPLAAFLGDNGAGYTVVSADLTNINGVRLSPGMFNGAGDVAGEIHLDQIGFLNLTTPPAISSLPKVLEDFESPGRSNWNQPAWFTDADPFATNTSFTAPAIDSGGSDLSGGTSCYAGHIKGHMDDGWVTLLGEFAAPYGTPIDISNNSVVGQLPAGGASGISFSVKVGAHNGQVYHIQLRRNSTGTPWNQFAAFIQEDSLAIGTWHRIVIPFPADGDMGGDPGIIHVGWTAHELWWGQWDISDPSSYKPWGRTDIYRFHVLPIVAGVGAAGDFDMWIDDVEFY